MEKKIINVEGMSCEHCVKAVTDALKNLAGMGSVIVDLESKTAAVEYDPQQVSIEKMVEAIEDQGYEVVA